MTHAELMELVDEELERFKIARLDDSCSSVDDFYRKTLEKEFADVKEVVGDSDIATEILKKRASDFWIRKEAWKTLNLLRLLVAINDAKEAFYCIDEPTGMAIEAKIKELEAMLKIFEETLYVINSEEEEDMITIEEILPEDQAEKVKKILKKTFEKIVYGEAIVHIELTPQAIEVIKDKLLEKETDHVNN